MSSHEGLMEIKKIINQALHEGSVHPDRHMVLSASRMSTAKKCEAQYVYKYIILPSMSTKRIEDITRKGKAFHLLAELDFDAAKAADLLSGLSHNEQADVRDFAKTSKNREYKDHVFLREYKEEEVQVRCTDQYSYLGILDWHGELEDRHIFSDYKTTSMSQPYNDRTQAIGYAFALCNKYNTTPDKITGYLDYVATDEIYPQEFNEDDMTFFRNYLNTMHRKIRKIEEKFFKSLDIRKVRHTRGDCGICPMEGVCRAYQTLVNPVGDVVEPEYLSTEELVREYYIRSDAEKANKVRTTALKNALLARANNGEEEVIRQYVTIIKKEDKQIETRKLLERLVPVWIRAASRNAKFADMIDWQKVESRMIPFIMSILPRNVKAGSVPEEYETKIRDIIRTVPMNPFITPKR